jgi:hypothetical protein
MEDLFSKALEFLASVEGSALSIALVLEFVFRLIPSKKPLSILFFIASFLQKLGHFFIKVGEFLDKVLPQKLEK